MYPPEAPYTIYCPRCWWSDTWDPFAYGKNYDFSKPFFEQLNELWHRAPLLGLSIDAPTSEASPYNNHAGHLKNCYLLFWADFTEDCSYGAYVLRSKSVVDSSFLILCESSYDLAHAFKTARSMGSYDLLESVDCGFLRDSENCQNCFLGANLRNKKHCFLNKPLAKEDYFAEINKWDTGSYKTFQELKRRATAHWKNFPPRPVYERFAVNCTGNRIYDSKNCKECFEVAGSADSKYLTLMYQPPVTDCYDVSGWGNNMERCYECGVVGENVASVRFTQESGLTLHDVDYGKLSTGGAYHFGCVSVKKGMYCILNRRYPEGEYWKLREKIIEHMNAMPYIDRAGNAYRYGEFFPPEMSPSAYNESMAYRFFPLSREEANSRRYRWRETGDRDHTITKSPHELPDHIKDAPGGIVNEVIGCAACPRGFKIIPDELSLLRTMNLPLPRRCPFCRINEKLDAWVKEFRLARRTCGACGAEFDTPHTKEDAPHILCKPCYLKEVV